MWNTPKTPDETIQDALDTDDLVYIGSGEDAELDWFGEDEDE